MTCKRLGAALGIADPATRPGVSDAPTDGDRLCIRQACRQARATYAELRADTDARLSAALRVEIGATVRSASPVLIALLGAEGLTLDDAVALIRPARFWPRRPALSNPSGKNTIRNPLWRYYMTTTPASHRTPLPRHTCTFHHSNGDYVRVQVIDHSLEVEAKIGPVWLETLFGELRVQLDDVMPQTLATACTGRTLEEIVDHEPWRGRGWRIIDVEEPVTAYFGPTLIVAVGSVPYRVAWPDADQPAPASKESLGEKR